MTRPESRPLLFLDVDGPLIPFGAPAELRPGGYPEYRSPYAPRAAEEHPLVSRIDPAHGRRLEALGCELVWASTWADDANTVIAPWLGLPALPVLPVAERPDTAEADLRAGLHWKTRSLVAAARGRAFAWVDDELTGTDRTWVAAHHRGPALLRLVDHRRGLTEADFAALAQWARAHR
ncbi:HAD domain-containing protein [Streptomyces sp. NPDC048001]|uniref:HAD domain-containing protein n=1 Tax=unclassified Streptomyces TaxID=2593676 RepID=UPI003721349E